MFYILCLCCACVCVCCALILLRRVKIKPNELQSALNLQFALCVCRMRVCELYTHTTARTQASMNSLNGVKWCYIQMSITLLFWYWYWYWILVIETSIKWCVKNANDAVNLRAKIQWNAEQNERKNNAVIHKINDRFFSN